MNDIVGEMPNFVSHFSWEWKGTAIGKCHCHCLLGFKLFASTMVGREMKKGGAVFGIDEKKWSPPLSLSKK